MYSGTLKEWKPAVPQECSSIGRVLLKTRMIIRRDMPEIMQIERESFEDPWFEEEFVKYLRERNVVGRVIECGERVSGFAIYELHKTRLHIANIAIAAGFRRCGIGRQVVNELIGKLGPQRRTRISLEVRETNLPAQAFFRSCGFKATAVLHDFYDDSSEDAYLMQYSVDCGERCNVEMRA